MNALFAASAVILLLGGAVLTVKPKRLPSKLTLSFVLVGAYVKPFLPGAHGGARDDTQ